MLLSLAQQSAATNPVLESLQHNTAPAMLSEVSENAWSASPARCGSQLTLKQVRQAQRENQKALRAEAPWLSRKKPASSLERQN